jgi:hypothetical protein
VRRKLRIAHEPGTIASAVSIGGETDLSRLLDGQPGDLEEVLRGRTFGYDSQRMKIFMDGEGLEEDNRGSRRRGAAAGALGALTSLGKLVAG